MSRYSWLVAYAAFARHWYLEPADQDDYLKRLGTERTDWLRGRVDPQSWQEDAERWPVDEEAPISAWETAAVWGARELQVRIETVGADAVLAGAGVANLAAWVGVANARAAGSPV